MGKNTQQGRSMTFGQLIRERRLAKCESQPTVAHRANISRVYLSRLEKDHKEPGLMIALRLIKALGIDPEYLGDIECGVVA